MGVFRSLKLFTAGLFTALYIFLAFTPAVTAQSDPTDSTTTAPLTGQTIQNGLCNGADLKLSDGPCNNSSDNGAGRVTKVIQNIINTISLIVGIAAVVMIMVGGLRYITSGGSDTSVTSAKNTILYAIIGLIIVALSQVMVRFVLRQISG